jgi:HPt (histidine-containing phosphotransfer) domain-containing protein
VTARGQDWDQFANLPGIDFAKGMDTWRDVALFRQFLQQFAIDHACSANQFSALLGAGEWVAASALMHKLKGAAATLSLTGVYQAARAIEDCTDAQAADALLPRLRPALDTAFASIAQLGPAASSFAPGRTDLARAAPLLTALLQAFDAGSAGPAGQLMADLTPVLPAGALGAIQDCLDGANFRAGAILVRELAREQAIALS